MIRAQPPALVTGPAEPLLTLAAAKAHMRVEHGDDDIYIAGLIKAAESHLDGWSGVLGRALVTQTWRVLIEDFPAGPRFGLPLAPVSGVVITYLDQAGVERTFDAALYHLTQRADGPTIELADGATWPQVDDRPDAVRVLMTCGYGAASAVPVAIRHAALMLVGGWYEQREPQVVGASVTGVPYGVQALLSPFRRVAR